MNEKIVYLRGLWSHPKAVSWIKDNLEKWAELEVDLFDYHEELVDDTSNSIYLERIVGKYEDVYGSDSDKIILMGHSHGGSLATILNSNVLAKKLILVNPAFRPWGVFRRVQLSFRQLFDSEYEPHFVCKYEGESRERVQLSFRQLFDSEYEPHFVCKYEGESRERLQYFGDNFKLLRDINRIMSTGTVALDSLKAIRNDLLVLLSMKDEFISVSSCLKAFRDCNAPYKDIMRVQDAEHALLEERDVYPKVYKKIADFIHK